MTNSLVHTLLNSGFFLVPHKNFWEIQVCNFLLKLYFDFFLEKLDFFGNTIWESRIINLSLQLYFIIYL